MNDKPISAPPPLNAAALPTAQATRISDAVTAGLQDAAGAGARLRVAELRVKAPLGASHAQIQAAVREAILAARGGRRP